MSSEVGQILQACHLPLLPHGCCRKSSYRYHGPSTSQEATSDHLHLWVAVGRGWGVSSGKRDFWQSVGHLGKTGQEEQEVLCPRAGNGESASKEGGGEVRKGGTCCLEMLQASAPEAENKSPVQGAMCRRRL